jgi:hypothetical protein
MGVLIAKPSEAIVAWIAGLTPADELAVRMALCKTNPWCEQDKGWRQHIDALAAQLIKSDADRERYEARAATMAQDMAGALRSMMENSPDVLNR